MTLDQRARIAATDVRDSLDSVDVPPAVGTVQGVQRRRRRVVAVAAVGAIAIVTGGLTLAGGSSSTTRIHATNPAPPAGGEPPAGTRFDGGWASIPKEGAGLGASTSIDVLVVADDTLFAGGTDSSVLNGPAKLWRSENTQHWTEPAHPTQLGSINAIAGHDLDLLAIGNAPFKSDLQPFVWSSSDRGRTWTNVAVDPNSFGVSAPQMGRPFVNGLHWDESTREWIASGGASDGYAGIWTSPDGAHWTARLAPGNSAGDVTIMDDGHGGWIAYWSTLAWSSPDGHTWTPFDLRLPDGYYLQSATADVAIAAPTNGTHTDPTPLVRSTDGGHTWTEDTTLLSQFPDAVGITIRTGPDPALTGTATTIIAGFSGANGNHTDAWVSTEPSTWHALPNEMKAQPGGTLTLIATLGTDTVIIGSAPELDHYFTVNTNSWGFSPSAPKACPGSVPRRLVEGVPADESADGLPPLDSAMTDPRHAQLVLDGSRTELQARYPGMRDAAVEPGFGRAWTGQNGGAFSIVDVDDYAIVVHFKDESACPEGAALYSSIQDVPLFFYVG